MPGRPTRFAHVIDDEEEDGEEEEVADKESEQSHANSPVADSDEEEEGIVDEYGLHAVDRRHLNEDQWEDAVISSAFCLETQPTGCVLRVQHWLPRVQGAS